MYKYLIILIIITILACVDGNDAIHIASPDNEYHELIGSDTPATPINVLEE